MERLLMVVVALAVVLTRTVLLWLFLPLSWLVWLVGSPWFIARRIPPTQILGWLDLNYFAAVSRLAPRRMVKWRAPWVPVARIGEVDHRIMDFSEPRILGRIFDGT